MAKLTLKQKEEKQFRVQIPVPAARTMLSPKQAAEFWQLLQKMLDSDAAIIVEGKKDRAALEKLGIPGSRIVALNQKPLFVAAEAVASDYKTVAILTDLDAEGKKLYGKLSTLLQQLGVKVDDKMRNFLFKSTRLRQIEGIQSIIQQ